MSIVRSIAALLIVASAFGCAEGGPGNQGSGGENLATSSSSGNGGNGGHGGGGGGNGGGGSSAQGGGGGSAVPIVINEISATGTDWVELGNASDTDFDLGGFLVADTTSKGNPDTDHATKFADNSLVPAHSYVIVVGGEKDDGSGLPQTNCLDKDGPATCFYATWKLSSSDGDGVFLIDKKGEIVTSAQYPANAVPDGDTYGRLPDMTGMFTANEATPGQPNHVP